MKRARLAVLCAAVGAACGGNPAPEPAPSSPPPIVTAPPMAASTSVVAVASAAPAVLSVVPAPAPEVLEGIDFLPQARLVFRIAACGGTSDVPARFDATLVSRHCAELEKAYAEYRRTWVDVARPFIASLRPKDLPTTVVYPFGGGDLTSVLATFPEAREITTISLEPAGDIRPIDTLRPERLNRELLVHRSHLERLFEKAHSRTDNLEKEARTDLPGEILFALAALAVYGDEPTSLRYFRLGPDGAPQYLTKASIDAATRPGDLRGFFANAELRFRRAGNPSAPVKVLRHISFNLDDDHLKADPRLMAYLDARPKVAAMTKAATHLLWNEHFRRIRGWLVGHTDWMISDSTGLPPRIAGPAGYTQDTYGTFDGPSPFGDPDRADADDVKHLFASEPTRDLPFRYGYPDKDGHAHLIVTHRPAR